MCDLAVDLDGSAGRLATELEALEPFVADGVVHLDGGLDPHPPRGPGVGAHRLRGVRRLSHRDAARHSRAV